jgi:hypothetical protein
VVFVSLGWSVGGRDALAKSRFQESTRWKSWEIIAGVSRSGGWISEGKSRVSGGCSGGSGQRRRTYGTAVVDAENWDWKVAAEDEESGAPWLGPPASLSITGTGGVW